MMVGNANWATATPRRGAAGAVPVFNGGLRHISVNDGDILSRGKRRRQNQEVNNIIQQTKTSVFRRDENGRQLCHSTGNRGFGMGNPGKSDQIQPNPTFEI